MIGGMEKTIRIWDGCRVIGILSVNQSGGSSWVSNVGGANNGARPKIELDPFAGLIVTEGIPTPVGYADDEEEREDG